MIRSLYVGLMKVYHADYINPKMRGESRRSWIQRNLDNSLAGQILDMNMILLSLMLVGMFIQHNWSGMAEDDPPWMQDVEIITGAIFTVDYFLRLYAAEDSVSYVMSFFSMVDILTVAPVWVTLIMEALRSGNSQDHKKFLRPIRVLRALRVLRAYRILNFLKTELQKQSFIIALIMVSIILCSSGIVQAVEYCDPQIAETTYYFGNELNCSIETRGVPYNGTAVAREALNKTKEFCRKEAEQQNLSLPMQQNFTIIQAAQEDGDGCQNLSFYVVMYFIVVTATTVGYGDYSPNSDLGQAFIMLMICLTAVLIPYKLSTLLDLMNRQDRYAAQFKVRRRKKHVLVCGEVHRDPLSYFLREFFHPERKMDIDKVVILCPWTPDPETTALMMLPQYETRVMWLRGSAMSDSDLHRAHVEHASACFVFVDKRNKDTEQTDSLASLITMSIGHWNPDIPIYSQSIISSHSRRLLVSGAHAVACVEEIKLNILASTFHLPGLTTFISNLLSTFSDQDEKKLLRSVQSGDNDHPSWMLEYIHGCCYEIYRFEVSENLDGLRFADVALILQAEFNSVLFAMLEDSTPFSTSGGPDQRVVQLFPADRHVHVGDYCYVLAQNAEIVTNIDRIDENITTKHVPAQSRRTVRKATRHSASAQILHTLGGTLHHAADAVHDVTKRISVRRSTHESVTEDVDLDNFGIEEDKKVRVTDVWDENHEISAYTHHMNSDVVLGADSRKKRLQSQTSDRGLSVGMAEMMAAAAEPLTTDTAAAAEASGDSSLELLHKSYHDFFDEDQIASVDYTGHVVLMGLPYELVDFIAPLRAKHISVEDVPPIVIISPLAPTKHHYEAAMRFPKVHFIRGSPLETDTLKRASLFKAHTVVIMANMHGKALDQFRDPNMVDADAITTLKFVSDAINQLGVNKQHEPRLVTEIIQTSNLKYFTWMLEQQILLDPKNHRDLQNEKENSKSKLTLPEETVSAFAEAEEASTHAPNVPMGDRRTSFMIMRQKKKKIAKATMDKLDSGRAKLHLVKTDRDSNLDYIFRPNFASGKVYLANLTDRMLSESFRQPQTVSIIRTLVCGDISDCGPRGGNDASKARKLMCLPLPRTFVAERFSNVFSTLLTKHKLLCIAILRAGESTGSPLPYLYTNPDGKTLLETYDKLFVIGTHSKKNLVDIYSSSKKGEAGIRTADRSGTDVTQVRSGGAEHTVI